MELASQVEAADAPLVTPLSRRAGEGLGVRATGAVGEGLGVRAIGSVGDGQGVRAKCAGEGPGVGVESNQV